MMQYDQTFKMDNQYLPERLHDLVFIDPSELNKTLESLPEKSREIIKLFTDQTEQFLFNFHGEYTGEYINNLQLCKQEDGTFPMHFCHPFHIIVCNMVIDVGMMHADMYLNTKHEVDDIWTDVPLIIRPKLDLHCKDNIEPKIHITTMSVDARDAIREEFFKQNVYSLLPATVKRFIELSPFMDEEKVMKDLGYTFIKDLSNESERAFNFKRSFAKWEKDSHRFAQALAAFNLKDVDNKLAELLATGNGNFAKNSMYYSSVDQYAIPSTSPTKDAIYSLIIQSMLNHFATMANRSHLVIKTSICDEDTPLLKEELAEHAPKTVEHVDNFFAFQKAFLKNNNLQEMKNPVIRWPSSFDIYVDYSQLSTPAKTVHLDVEKHYQEKMELALEIAKRKLVRKSIKHAEELTWNKVSQVENRINSLRIY